MLLWLAVSVRILAGSGMSIARRKTVPDENKLRVEDRAAHDWYRFVLSFPPHSVRDYVERFSIGSQSVLDSSWLTSLYLSATNWWA